MMQNTNNYGEKILSFATVLILSILTNPVYAETVTCSDGDPSGCSLQNLKSNWSFNNSLTPSASTVGGLSETNPNNNTVNFSRSHTTKPDWVFGAFNGSNKTVTGNNVNISNGTVNRGAAGGYSNTGHVTNNSLNMSGGKVSGFIHGGYSQVGDATNNRINISGGTLDAIIHGGISYGNGDATGNKITISGGTLTKDIYGGRSFGNGGGGTGNTSNNTITVKKGNSKPIFTNTILYGGNTNMTGNTLNLHTSDASGGISVKNINNFENLYFYIQSDTTNMDTFLTLTDSGGTNISGSNIGLGIEGSDTQLTVGNQITLINKPNGALNTGGIINFPNALSGLQGIAVVHDFTIAKQGNNIVATVTGSQVNPQVKSLSEARLAAVDFVNRGIDLADNDGMNNLLQATQEGNFKTFSAIGAEKTRTDTGSHVDVKGVHILLGVGNSLSNNTGTLSLGGYLEYGSGSYDSYNDFANRPDVHASGNTYYYGIGMLAKQQFNNQWFIDGGVRLGKSKTDYYSSDLLNAAGNPTDFSSKANYWGVNIGVGKTIELDETNNLTPYAKLLYTHYDNDSHQIAGSTFDFSNIDSLRSRLGVRWQHQLDETSQFYADAAWEHEFQGTAKGEVLGFAMPEPSLKGDTGVINVGVSFNPNEKLSIDVGIQGEFGKRSGVSAVSKLKYSF